MAIKYNLKGRGHVHYVSDERLRLGCLYDSSVCVCPDHRGTGAGDPEHNSSQGGQHSHE